MGIMDSFRGLVGAAPATSPMEAQNTPATAPAAQGTNLPTQGAAQNTPANLATPNEPVNPLDQFKDVWTAPQGGESGAPAAGMFNIDPNKIMAAASKVDFSKVVTPELAQRMSQGGEDGVRASMEAMSKMAQLNYAQSAMATTKIVEQAVKKAQEAWAAQIPGLIKKQNVGESVLQENPALAHPAAQPIIAALQSQLTTKYPNATTQEIKSMVSDYLTSFAQSASPQKPAAQTKSTKGETDWEKFLG